MYMYFKVLNLEYVPGYGSGRSAQLYSCTNDIVWDTNTTCTNTVCIRIRVPVPIYLFAEYPGTGTTSTCSSRPRTAVPEGIRQGTKFSILNLV